MSNAGKKNAVVDEAEDTEESSTDSESVSDSMESLKLTDSLLVEDPKATGEDNKRTVDIAAFQMKAAEFIEEVRMLKSAEPIDGVLQQTLEETAVAIMLILEQNKMANTTKSVPVVNEVEKEIEENPIAAEPTAARIPFASEEDDCLDGPEPIDDYERFLVQFANADLARRMLLHSANVRISDLEHRANCWKLLRVCNSVDLRGLFEIVMKLEKAITMDEFETTAFLKPYATPEFRPENTCSTYAEYMEQFHPGLPLKNFFPELGLVTGEVPLSFGHSPIMLHQQPAINLDPSVFETSFRKTKYEKFGANKKKTMITKNEEIKPMSLFEKNELKKCVPVKKWSERYRKSYTTYPTNALLLRGLSPDLYKEFQVEPRKIEFALISNEFDEAVEEYKKTTNPQLAKLGRSLAEKYIDKRLPNFDHNEDPTIITTYKNIKKVMNEEMVTDVNAIYRCCSDKEKFSRLEKVLYIKYHDTSEY